MNSQSACFSINNIGDKLSKLLVTIGIFEQDSFYPIPHQNPQKGTPIRWSMPPFISGGENITVPTNDLSFSWTQIFCLFYQLGQDPGLVRSLNTQGVDATQLWRVSRDKGLHCMRLCLPAYITISSSPVELTQPGAVFPKQSEVTWWQRAAGCLNPFPARGAESYITIFLVQM